ncbi:MDR family MFS transporter [Amycolatopsis sp. NPDC059657]|uniref:MDR family MFS transporter n=1 Tax=Amycolatopsis sp. NPDC059657 TaxID=3346899 RepID=UPI00366AD300
MTTTSAPPPTRRVSQGRLIVIFIALLIGMFVSAIDQMVVTTLALSIVQDLDGAATTAAGQTGWLVTAYLLTSTAVMPLAGKISDLYGRKLTYIVAMGLFVLGSLLAALSTTMPMLILARGIQGVGSGALVSVTFAVLADLVSPRERGKYQGGFGAVFASSSLLGPVIGGLFAGGGTVFGFAVDWHAVFAINIPIGVLAIAVNAFLLPASYRRDRPKLDMIGAVLMVAGVSGVLLAVQWGGQSYPWGSWQVLLPALGGLVLLVAFVLWERRAVEPILPIRLFRDRTFSILNLGSLLLGMVFSGLLIYLTVFVQLAQHVSPTDAGLSMLPLTLSMVGTSVLTGMMASKFGRFRIFILLGAPLLATGGVLLTTLTPESSIWTVRVFALVVGVGAGLMQQMFILGTQNAATDDDLGVVTVSSTFFRTLGGAVGGSLFGVLLTLRLSSLDAIDAASPQAYVTAMTPVFLTVAAFAAVIFVTTLFVPDRQLRDLDEETLALAELGVTEA